MSDTENEGMSFTSVFTGAFKPNPASTADRKKAEQRAMMTPGQRGRKAATKTEQVNFRTSEELKTMLGLLAKDMGMSVAETIETLIEKAAAERKIGRVS